MRQGVLGHAGTCTGMHGHAKGVARVPGDMILRIISPPPAPTLVMLICRDSPVFEKAAYCVKEVEFSCFEIVVLG